MCIVPYVSGGHFHALFCLPVHPSIPNARSREMQFDKNFLQGAMHYVTNREFQYCDLKPGEIGQFSLAALPAGLCTSYYVVVPKTIQFPSGGPAMGAEQIEQSGRFTPFANKMP